MLLDAGVDPSPQLTMHRPGGRNGDNGRFSDDLLTTGATPLLRAAQAFDNDVVIENGHISRRHCAIVVHVRTGCEIHDVASKNGTFLNGERLAGSVHLKSGDEIRMCDRNFVFMSKQGAEGQAGHGSTKAE